MNTAIITFRPELGNNGKWTAEYDNKIICRAESQQYCQNIIDGGKSKKAQNAKVTSWIIDPALKPSDSFVDKTTLPTRNFSISDRFEFLSRLSKMIIDNTICSLIVTGEGGLGKTHTVLDEIKKANLLNCRDFEDLSDEEDSNWENPGDYIIIKGYSTPKGLYRTLYDFRDKTIIFDDCDSVLRDGIAINLLKAALDSYDERIINWNSDKDLNAGSSKKLPRSFEFTGRVIFISNLSQNRLDQAIKSRSLRVDLSMTTNDKISRMQTILPGILPHYEMSVKRDALDFISANRDIATDLNFRTLHGICKIAAAHPNDWKGLAEYTITA